MADLGGNIPQFMQQENLQKGLVSPGYTMDTNMFVGSPFKLDDTSAINGLNYKWDSATALNNPVASGDAPSWFSQQDLGMKGLGGTAVGLGNLGLGIMSYLDQKETAKKQRKLYDQQIDQNKYVMAKSKADSASLAKAFGTA